MMNLLTLNGLYPKTMQCQFSTWSQTEHFDSIQISNVRNPQKIYIRPQETLKYDKNRGRKNLIFDFIIILGMEWCP